MRGRHAVRPPPHLAIFEASPCVGVRCHIHTCVRQVIVCPWAVWAGALSILVFASAGDHTLLYACYITCYHNGLDLVNPGPQVVTSLTAWSTLANADIMHLRLTNDFHLHIMNDLLQIGMKGQNLMDPYHEDMYLCPS